MPPISFPSAGTSKYDFTDILTKLEQNERLPLTALTAKQKATQATINAVASLRGLISNLNGAGAALGKSGAFDTMKPTVTGNGFSASAASGAVAGNYQINVTQLATTQVLRTTQAVLDRKLNIGDNGDTGDITITMTDGSPAVQIALGDNTSLEGVAAAINGNENAGVRAAIIDDGTGNSFLTLSAKKSGATNTVAGIGVTGNDRLKALLLYGTAVSGIEVSSVNQVAVGQNATLTVNGIDITSPSNTINGVIDNVTLNLTAAGGGMGSLELAAEPTAATKAINDFVSAYNSMLTGIKSSTAYDKTSKTGSALTGESFVLNAQSMAADALRVSVAGGLAQLGITTDYTTGFLKVDSAKLSEALTKNPADVTRIFSGPGGVSERLSLSMKNILGDGAANKGSLALRVASLEKQLKEQDAQYSRLDQQIYQTMSVYKAQYTALSQFLSNAESSQNTLAQLYSSGSK
jgi:flagellar hook-associated protein 2